MKKCKKAFIKIKNNCAYYLNGEFLGFINPLLGVQHIPKITSAKRCKINGSVLKEPPV